MRKFAALFLTVLLTLSLPALAEEGDWSLEEILINADPAVVNQTVTGNGAEEEGGEDEDFSGMDDGSAQEMLRQAMSQGFGVVDKIDFDELTFETEDE